MKVEIDPIIALDLLACLANKAKEETIPKYVGKIYIETIENLSKAILEECANNQSK